MFFFLQAEDGIRDYKVTGVQTCALPISAGDGLGLASGALSGVDSKSEREPVSEGKPRVNAISMNATAAPIVIFANRLAVPRGPNAVLEIVFEKSAPASALPGCSRITTIRMKHARMKR